MTSAGTTARCTVFAGMLVLASCGKAEAPPVTTGPKPSLDPALAVHPTYRAPAGWRTECIGRQLIDVPTEMQWALADKNDPSLNGAVFSERLKGLNDVWGHDGMSVGVSAQGGAAMWERVREGERAMAMGFVNLVKQEIETAHFIEQQSQAEGNATSAKKWQEVALSNQALINRFRELDFGLPDSFIRTTGSEIRAYLWRGGRVYRFLYNDKPENYAKTEAHVRDYLSRFRPRALYEIPSGPGVCYPYAFVADNGSRWFDIKNSFRLADAKGVVYSVRIGRNGDKPDMGAVETLLMGSPLMQWAAPRTAGAKKLGLQDAEIGPYPVWLSGVVMSNRERPADGDYYRVVSAFIGEENSDQLPFIRFEMNGYARGYDTPLDIPSSDIPGTPMSITEPTPPVEQSVERMRAIMKSIRLRPAKALN